MAYPGYRPQYPPTPTGLRPQTRPTNQPVQHRNSRDSQPHRSEEGDGGHPIQNPFLSLNDHSAATFAPYAHSVLSLQPRPPHRPASTSPFSPLTSHFPLLTSSPSLLPGLLNHSSIGWPVPRRHAPVNARPWCITVHPHSFGRCCIAMPCAVRMPLRASGPGSRVPSDDEKKISPTRMSPRNIMTCEHS
jgi:hypothetical protein